MTLYDLRYSARSLADATRESRKPQPQPIRRTVKVYSFARRGRDRSLTTWSALEERRERQRLRSRVGTLLGLVREGLDPGGRDAVGSVDIPPARHRRNALWHA
ncbi:hypothetical protein ACFV20_32555 [Streptomyces sp. NPDC059696]|uniref:hypothetical protein n=1 Tax=Streptomyces sp. NPDC059696 TaxID=3346911 RepID=UPI0036A44A6A